MPMLTLEIEATQIVATMTRRNRVQWNDEALVASRDVLEARLGGLLARAPRTRTRPRVVVRLAFPLAQVKRLDGLPGGVRPRVAAQIAHENVGAFFLRAGPVLVISDVRRDADGAVWAAAYDRSIIDEIVRAVAERGWKVASVEPATSALPAEQVGRTRAAFAWNPARSDARPGLRGRVVSVAVAAAVATGVVAVACGPPLRIRLWASAHAGELRQSASARVAAATAAAELARVTRTLSVAQSFAAGRGAFTTLLGRIAEALPDSTALVTLRVDSVEVSMVAVSPRVTDVLSALAPVDSGNGVRITSTVAREVIGGLRLERAAFRVRRLRLVRRSTAPARTANAGPR